MLTTRDRAFISTGSQGFGRPTHHRAGRRGRRRRAAAIVLVLAVTVAVSLGLALPGRVAAWRHPADHHGYLGADGWPRQGQAAWFYVGRGSSASPDQRPVPIASIAKVMTAYVVVSRHPVTAGQQGPTLTVSAADVEDTARRERGDESVVDVRAGEQLTEVQALAALLIPSANNVAAMLARWSAGSLEAFVIQMNAAAASLHMTHTTYTDPSGLDAATASTAADQLLLARVVARNPLLAEIMRMTRVDLPVAGTVENTDTLLGHDGFVGMKTGSTDAAGGCFMFHVVRPVLGRPVELFGVVLGQPEQHGRPLYEAGLNAARQLADLVATANP